MFPRLESQNAIPAYMIRNLTVNVNAGTLHRLPPAAGPKLETTAKGGGYKTLAYNIVIYYTASVLSRWYLAKSRRIFVLSARRIFDGAAVATARKFNEADGRIGK